MLFQDRILRQSFLIIYFYAFEELTFTSVVTLMEGEKFFFLKIRDN